MGEASSSSNGQANDRTNVQNQMEIEQVPGSRDPQGDAKYRLHLELYRLIQKNDWKKVETFVYDNQYVLKENDFLGRSVTIFHLIMGLLADVESDDAATNLLCKLAWTEGVSETLEHQDRGGNTVLSLCAIRGNLKASKVLVKRKRDLLEKMTRLDRLPVHLAALYGHKKTYEYLLDQTYQHLQKKTPHGATNFYSGGNGAMVVSNLIKANLYDEAFKLLKDHPEIINGVDSQKMILESLAAKPDAFESGSRLGCFQRFIYKYMPVNKELASIQTNDNPDENAGAKCYKFLMWLWNALCPCCKAIYAQKLTHMRAVEIVKFICEKVVWTDPDNRKKLKGALFRATRLGIPEFVNQFISAYKYSALLFNSQKEKHGIFELAVLHRRENVFNLIHGINSSYFSMPLVNEKTGDNILHLTGKSEPSLYAPAGAALKMQRELQWFKVVESLVLPHFREAENKQGKTPREVFTEEHRKLVKQGEKWMRDTTSSCSVVAALIITVTFAAAFNVPGGRDSRGIPNFLDQPSFMVFAISDALALFSSTASVITFLSILTSSL